MGRIDETTQVVRLPEQRAGTTDRVTATPRSRSWPIALVTATALVIGGVAWVVVGVDRGDGATTAVPVVGAPVVLVHDEALTAAGAAYRDYVVAEAAALRDTTAEFVAAVTDRRIVAAKALYPQARSHWERIQVAADSVGDLGGDIDGQGVGLNPDETFTGFHRLERDLWLDGPQIDTNAIADKLLADVTLLADGAGAVEFGGHDLCGGAKELIDFAVVTALPGYENRWADTDLADLAARVEGSQAAAEALRPLVTELDPELQATLDRRYAAALALLDTHRVGGAYRLHSELSPADLKGLADVLDALGEPASRLGATVMV